VDDPTLIQLFAQMDAHTARQDEILAHHSTMLDRVDDRGRQHTDAMLRIADTMARLHDSLDRMDKRHEAQQTQLGEILAQMAGMLLRMDERLARQDEILARMDEHTTMIAQILSQFQQGRNGHA
jgi:septal ring factor EnvC (AmiA/AmiB activator)